MAFLVNAAPVAIKLPYVRWFNDTWRSGLSSWYAKPPTYDGTRWLQVEINTDDIYASTTIDGTYSAVANWSGTFVPFSSGNAQEERFIRYENNRYFFMDSRSGTANAGKVWSTGTYDTATVEQTGLGTNQGVSDCIWVGGTVNRFIAVGLNGQVWTTTSSFPGNQNATWTLQTTPVTTQLREIAFNGTTIVAVGASGTIISSTNGTSWTDRTGSSSFGVNNINSIVWTGSHFVAIGSAGTLGYSSTGTSGWTQRTLFSDVTTIVLTLLSHRGGFLFVGNKGSGSPDAGTGSQPESYRSTTTNPAGAWVQVSSGSGSTPFTIRNARKGTSNGFYAAYGYSPGANINANTAYSI